MKVQYKSLRFSATKRDLIRECAEIIDTYMGQGLTLTLRQLYYQLVTRNTIENKERSYKNLGTLVSNARLAGLLDWDAIEDRVRVPRSPPEYTDLNDLANAALNSYRLPRWDGQSYYAELWVEKDALAGVLSPLASEFHVTLMVNRGYSSQTAMRDGALRFEHNGSGKNLSLFYLGDHDPSGEDMVRDIRDRFAMFGVADVEVQKIALTIEQVREYDPPPNPTKVSDPRADKYIAEHGDESWEVDALPPNVLAQLVRDAFAEIVNTKLMDKIKRREERDKKDLRKAVAHLRPAS
jgi:hypothetical protein